MSTSPKSSDASNAQTQNSFHVSPKLVLEVLRHWWMVATPVGILLALAVCGVMYLRFEPIYRAKVLFVMAPGTDFSQPSSRQRRSDTFIANQMATLHSEVTLEPLLADKRISEVQEIGEADDPVAFLRQNMKVSSAFRGSSQFHLFYSNKDPEVAAIVANAIYESYVSKAKDAAANRRSLLLQTIGEIHQDKTEEVRRLRDEFRTEAIRNLHWDPYALTKTTSAPGGSALTLEAQLAQLAIDQAIVKYQLERTQTIQQQVRDNLTQSQDSANISDAELELMVEQSAAMLQRKENVRQAEGVIESLQQSLADIEKVVVGDPAKLPRHRSLTRQVELQQEHIRELEKNLDPFRAKLMEKAREDRQLTWQQYQQSVLAKHAADIQKYQETADQLVIQETVLKEKYEAEIKEVQNAQGETFDMVQLQQTLRRAESQALDFEERESALRLQAKNLDSIQLLKPALAPKNPSIIAPWKEMALGGGVGLLIPFGLAFLWELRTGRITEAKQIENQSNLPVLAEIARFPSHSSDARVSRTVNRQLRLFEESVHHLRTSLVLSRPLEEIQVLAVTSSVSGEGKTTLAAQLAMSIARASGELTLLIDGDMRAPDLYDVFEIPNQPGFAELLEDHASLASYVTEWDEHCHILPAGRLASSPHRLLANGAFSGMLAEARQKYRHIVVDTPPVLAAGEAMVIAKAADATLLCAKRDVTRMEQLKKSRERLLSSGAEVVGCVFNDVPPNSYTYRYGYYGYEDVTAV